MDQKQIEEIVRAVLTNISTGEGGVKKEKEAVTSSSSSPSSPSEHTQNIVSDEALPDLGSDEVKNWIGVQHPIKKDVLVELKRATASRVAVGRSGPRPRTLSLLRFLADHSRSKDTVIAEIPKEWVEKHNLLEVRSIVEDKDQYLTRPDLGRRLSPEAIETIKEKCKSNVDVQVVVSDGLSTEALLSNYDEILPPLMKGLESSGLTVGTPFFLRYGRVKAEDQIGELLKAKVVVLLIGERPGLGQSESLSCYMVYEPAVATTVEADRTCISNIHKNGTPPVEAAAVIVDMAQKMIKNRASGIQLAAKGA